VLQSVPRAGVDAPRLARHAPVHQLRLRLERNRFHVLQQDPPWKIVRAFPQPTGETLVHLNNISGGVLAGDRLALEIAVEAGAAAQITTTGATRLYRHRPGAGDSEHSAAFWIGEGARLEYLPDPLIPYAGSRHTQRTAIHLEENASLFWWEVLAPGRHASGEVFAFDRLCVQSEIRTRDLPLLLESFLLEPAARPLAVTARMREYSYLASLYACQEGKPPTFWRELENRLNQAASERTRPGEAMWGASALVADGVVVRGLGASSRFVSAALIDFWRLTRLAVTGENPSLPRKIY
jgi:urease accessory protein